MTSSKHDSTWPEGVPKPPSDLEQNPGIGGSKGAFRTGLDPATITGDSTFEGDVGNGTTKEGGVPEGEPGRTNR